MRPRAAQSAAGRGAISALLGLATALAAPACAAVALADLVPALGSRLDGPSGTSRFGTQLAALGDVDGDGYDDIAIGAPAQPHGSTPEAGAVYLVYGTSVGAAAADFDAQPLEQGGREGHIFEVDTVDLDRVLPRGQRKVGAAPAGQMQREGRLPRLATAGELGVHRGTRTAQGGGCRARPGPGDHERFGGLVDAGVCHRAPFGAGTPRARMAWYTRRLL